LKGRICIEAFGGFVSERLNNNDEVIATEQVLYSNQELVTVAEFPDPATANVARTALEAAGIPVFLQGENANSLLPVAFEARVQVRPEDEAPARQVLQDFEAQPVTFEDVSEAEAESELGGTGSNGGGVL
jgi:hypothetical protein